MSNSSYLKTNLPKRLLDKKMMARLLGLSTETILRMVRRGDLPAKKLAGRLRFDPREISQWLDEQAEVTGDGIKFLSF